VTLLAAERPVGREATVFAVEEGQSGSGFFSPTTMPKSAALAYEADFVPAVMLPCAEVLADAVEIPPGARILDVACGTGALTRVVAARCGRDGSVVGIDHVPAMLAIARDLELHGAEFRLGDAAALPVSHGEFDIALCQQGLQFFSDRAAAVAEMRRALPSGGRMGVTCWAGPEANPLASVIIAADQRAGWPDLDASLSQGYGLGDPDRLAGLIGAGGLHYLTGSR
jgi:SAM-dependent methyltransferase